MSSLTRLPHAPSMGLGAAVEAFLADRDLAVSTRRVYELTLAALAKDLGSDVEVASISRDDLRAFLHARHHTVAAKTWNRVVATLLHWVRRMLQVRKEHHDVFGRGSLRMLEVENPAVLAYVRQLGDDVMLCMNNLSSTAQPAELALQDFLGKVPVERLGATPFPPVHEGPYVVTLPAHAFFWFKLEDSPTPARAG